MNILSVDCETYGSCLRSHNGILLPPQTVFNPRRSLLTDRCPPAHLILLTAATRCSIVGDVLDRQSIASLTPVDNRVFSMWDAHHVAHLVQWLDWADVLLGQNFLFDLLYMRTFHPVLRKALNGRHILIDATHLNFLQDETRPERSLKDIGPVLGLFSYTDTPTLRDFRFDSPSALHKGRSCYDYVSMDAWNTALAVSEFARLMQDQFPDSDKLSPFCISYFSDLIYSVLRFTEAGVPVSRTRLAALEKKSYTTASRLTKALAPVLKLEGEGSPASRLSMLRSAFVACDTTGSSERVLGLPTIYASDIVEHTKTGALSAGAVNRQLALALLPKDDAHHAVLSLWQERDDANNILSRYTYPLLRKRRTKHKSPHSVILLPQPKARSPRNPDAWLAHSLWYLTPSNFKDGSGGSGGQKQARPASRDPCPQQWPPEMKACLISRYPNGFLRFKDLSQIEMRVPTLCSGDPILMQAYAPSAGIAELDLHTQSTITLLGKAALKNPNFGCGDMRIDPRQWGKRGNFARLYRAAGATCQAALLKDAGVLLPITLWDNFVRATRHEWPDLWAWQSEIISRAHRDGILVLPITGHSRYFMGGLKWDENEICNFPVQAPAAITLCDIFNYMLRLLPDINHPDPPYVPVMNWYDAIVFDCRNRDAALAVDAAYAEAVTYCFTEGYWSQLQSHYGRSVPLKYSTKSLPVQSWEKEK